MEIESLVEYMKTHNHGGKIGIRWINSNSPVIDTTILPTKIDLPNGYEYDEKKGIFCTDEDRDPVCYSVNYMKEKSVSPKRHFFSRHKAS